MADFSETSISRNAKRVFTAPIATVEAFSEVISAFTAETDTNIVKNLTAATYKVRVNYKTAAGDDAGYNLCYANTVEQMNEFASLLKGNEATETMAGTGGSSEIPDEDYHWLVKFSCTKVINIDGTNYEDTFTVSIGREYMLISGFTYDATLTSIETWADAQTALA